MECEDFVFVVRAQFDQCDARTQRRERCRRIGDFVISDDRGARCLCAQHQGDCLFGHAIPERVDEALAFGWSPSYPVDEENYRRMIAVMFGKTFTKYSWIAPKSLLTQ